MNLSFIKNTNLFSLLMFSLTSLPISFASCSVNNSLDNEVSNSFINLSELAITRSSITTKLFSTNNGYLFLQGGHNLSMSINKDSCFTKSIDYGFGGSAYIDGVYRHLFNRSLYINGGLGFKAGKLSTEKYNGFIDSLNYGLGLFVGFKHANGIEASLQGDLPIFNSNGKTGMILNAKYGLFSVELGLNNLYSSINTDWKTVFIAGRFNIIELISKTGIIGRGLSRFIDLQILIGYDLKRGVIHRREFSIGLFKKYTSVLEEFNNVGKILKNNTMEYGWNDISSKDLKEKEYEKLISDCTQLPQNIQEKIEKYNKEIDEYVQLILSDQPIPIDIQENMQEDMQKKRQEFEEVIREVKLEYSEEERKFKESLPEESKEIYVKLMEEISPQMLLTKETTELISELSTKLEEIKGNYIEEILQEIKSIHKELEESGDIQQFLCKTGKFLGKLQTEISKEFLNISNQIFDSLNKIIKDKEKKLLECLKNQEQYKKTFKKEEKEQILQLIKKQLNILEMKEKFEISLQIHQKNYVIIKQIYREFYKNSINHQKITKEHKENLEIYMNNLIKLELLSYCNMNYIMLQNCKRLLPFYKGDKTTDDSNTTNVTHKG